MSLEILSTRKGKKAVLNLRCKTFHYVILTLIKEKPVNTIEIYRTLNIRNEKYRQKVTNLMRNLEDKEFVFGMIDVKNDTRVNIYFLTDKGKMYLEKISDESEDRLICLMENQLKR